ncbi:MAG: tRNA pseudouridine(55) synthase TruB [Trueperaceae bacterium]|nr:tRNA pseudouridine(55) synthase TruB [Trueperaceae bacterium]
MAIHPVDKPLGPTSHDVVGTARRAFGTRRVGHAGTLDPLATGVLVLLTEEDTKLSPWLTGSTKRYLAWVAFGGATASGDAQGPLEARSDPSALDADAIEAAARGFLDVTEQVPPRHSAVKIDGERAYAAAHRGEAYAALPARPAGYRTVTLLGVGPAEALPTTFAPSAGGWRPAPPDAPGARAFERPPPLADLPVALFDVEVQAGTYLRAFARDLGEGLGVPAHLAGLVRTASGSVDLADAAPLDRLAEAPALAARDVLPLPAVPLSDDQVARVRQGQRLPLADLALPTALAPLARGEATATQDGGTDAMLLDAAGDLVAIAHLAGGRMRLRRVWPAA